MARKGSDDVISRQNLRLVNNKPLLYYIISTALKFKKADVLVSTDSEEGGVTPMLTDVEEPDGNVFDQELWLLKITDQPFRSSEL